MSPALAGKFFITSATWEAKSGAYTGLFHSHSHLVLPKVLASFCLSRELKDLVHRSSLRSMILKFQHNRNHLEEEHGRMDS